MVIVDQAILIHSIIIGKELRVENLILRIYIRIIAQSSDSRSRLGFLGLIHHLCKIIGVSIEQDILIKIARPITVAVMKRRVRRYHNKGQEEEPQHQLPPASLASEPQAGPSQPQA
ncbi:uncharacterized protein DS421_9g263630 [Arachis hypogaea]|nr:uncharacterized protein DS421_9g263630 [Arachis hypogaea]